MSNVLAMHPLHQHKEWELAQAYVQVQPLKTVFSPEEGLCKGTIFPNLHKPYAGWQKTPECK
jgi:hypothetical protein